MNYPTPHINAVPGDFGQTVLMPGDPLRGLLRACDGGGDGLGRFIQTVDGQMLVFGRAPSGGAEDHRQTRLAEQGVHGLAAVGIGNGNDII